MKKLKGFDGLTMSIGEGYSNTESTEGVTDNGLSQRFVGLMLFFIR